MKKLKTLLSLSAIVLITTASQATNYQDRDCVHSYNIMNRYVNKILLNEKLRDNIVNMKVHCALAKAHATDTVNDCKYVKPEFSHKAQENYDELVAIEGAMKYAKEYAEIEVALKRIIAEV